ncbi:hypothetical protein D9758_007108 [Tetrapyrgos nigripes]|uniref:Arabinanase/levansucrase/invertase n=1 Tax=Tetrapyrgos nigripes TaxID=182062 RepID=A0A8H5GDK9_9AGAR|nr:hypothetical protein D9758_007108 [Tetrapyrgos nigripes]
MQIQWWKLNLAIFAFLLAVVDARKNRYIVPGAPWYDTDGNLLSAHAGGIVEHDGKWYWFGQNERIEDKDLFSGINAYSSSDLLNWDYEGRALSSINGTVIGPDTVVERPKAVFNEETQTWVLWFHSDNSTYGLLRQGVATSPNISGKPFAPFEQVMHADRQLRIYPGPYDFQGVFSPLGGTSQDFGLFQDVDHDGASYALYSNGDADAAHDNLIARMNSTFTGVEELVYEFPDFDLEAPTMFFSGTRYYILMSHKTGYRPNNVVVFSAEKLEGPWSAQSYIATLGTRTFNSQSTMIISVKGSERSTFLYAGDQWTTAKDLYLSTYVWLPMSFNDNTGALNVDWHDLYSIDVKTGSITVPNGESYEAEDGEISGVAYSTLCPTCSGGRLVTNIQGNGTLTISSIQGTGQPQWVSIYYHNPDGKWGDNRGGDLLVLNRTATITVNDDPPITLRQPSGSAGIILSQPLNVTFKAGGENRISFNGFRQGLASDVDKIVVYGNIYDD